MTNLTETSTFTTPVTAPDNGENIEAAPSVTGTVRNAFQALTNRTKYVYDKVTAILAGTRTLKGITVDGTGDNAVAGTPGAIITTGLIQTTGGFLNVAQDALIGGYASIGSYIQAAGNIGSSVSLTCSNWGSMLLDGAKLRFTSVGTTATGGNPPIGTSVKNQLRAAMVPKAWGCVRRLEDGSGIIAEGLGFNGYAAVIDTPMGLSKDGIVVYLTDPMDNANYSVVITGNWTITGGADMPRISQNKPKTTTQFGIATHGMNWDTSDGMQVNFVVFGRQTT